ncbi:MAG: hypothetical protein IJR52_02785 [Selenomonadaceae bacterium]|nr:hypothetical protein [Selenomonadaceae bacterium]MBQ9496483.1 hypothetical protein [Selenomonadaceae bacterium]
MQSKVAVVIPVYKEEIDDLEKISLAQARKILGKYPFVFVAPEGKKISYAESGDSILYFPPQFFQNTVTYSMLLMSPFFYEAFKAYDYILIYQLDAFVFYDALEKFCSLGYDYIGAPWPYCLRLPGLHNNNKTPRVGNGGFSLRNVNAHIKLLNEYSDLTKKLMGVVLEDDFFAYCGANDTIDFHIAPVDIALNFAVEYLLERAFKNLKNKLPFGCHGWTRRSADFYVKLFAQFGYDLRPLRPKMDNLDYRSLQGALLTFATKRLISRVNHRQSLMRYLPRNHFASVRVIRSQLAMMIFAQLFLENPALADDVHLYEEREQHILLNDLTPEREPHLIIGFDNVDNVVTFPAEKKDLTYGKEIVSFQQEYLNYCEKIFHALGK